MDGLKFLGVGGALNIEMGSNCAYLKKNKKLILVDCGESASIKLENVKAFDGVEEAVVFLTHMHADHVAGLGVFIWICNYIYNIIPKIFATTKTFVDSIETYLNVVGVTRERYEIVVGEYFIIDELMVKQVPTKHVPNLECFGIMFSDKEGKYYYSGDTNDIKFIEELVDNKEIKKIYCEANVESFGVHIAYSDLLKLDKSKLILMHFGNREVYSKALNDGFEVGKVC